MIGGAVPSRSQLRLRSTSVASVGQIPAVLLERNKKLTDDAEVKETHVRDVIYTNANSPTRRIPNKKSVKHTGDHSGIHASRVHDKRRFGEVHEVLSDKFSDEEINEVQRQHDQGIPVHGLTAPAAKQSCKPYADILSMRTELMMMLTRYAGQYRGIHVRAREQRHGAENAFVAFENQECFRFGSGFGKQRVQPVMKSRNLRAPARLVQRCINLIKATARCCRRSKNRNTESRGKKFVSTQGRVFPPHP